MLGVHARAEHATVIRQRTGHADEGAVAPWPVKVDAPVREQPALSIEEVRQRPILQPFAITTADGSFRQWTKIAERRTKCRLLRQSAEADAVQSRVRLRRYPREKRHGLVGAGCHEDAAVLGSCHYGAVDEDLMQGY